MTEETISMKAIVVTDQVWKQSTANENFGPRETQRPFQLTATRRSFYRIDKT